MTSSCSSGLEQRPQSSDILITGSIALVPLCSLANSNGAPGATEYVSIAFRGNVTDNSISTQGTLLTIVGYFFAGSTSISDTVDSWTVREPDLVSPAALVAPDHPTLQALEVLAFNVTIEHRPNSDAHAYL